MLISLLGAQERGDRVGQHVPRITRRSGSRVGADQRQRDPGDQPVQREGLVVGIPVGSRHGVAPPDGQYRTDHGAGTERVVQRHRPRVVGEDAEEVVVAALQRGQQRLARRDLEHHRTEAGRPGKFSIVGDPLDQVIKESEEAKETIVTLIGQKAPSEDAVRTCIELVKSVGGVEKARAMAEFYAMEALQQLGCLSNNPYSEALRDMVSMVLERDS